jgi:succinoglycan biosynthesis protein ExoH
MTEASLDLRPTKMESEFISMTRFLMIIGLTFHHMFQIPSSEYYPRDPIQTYSFFVPDLFNGFFHMAFMAAVPALSVISGYLFFRRRDLSFPQLLKARFFTVALPAWIWAAIWLLVGFALFKVGQKYGLFGWMNYDFDKFTGLTLLNGIVGYDQNPFALQFWFVHDLILTLLLSPVVYHLLRTTKLWALPVMFAVWLTGYVPPLFFSMNVLFFFAVGAGLAFPQVGGLQNALEKVAHWGGYAVPVFVLALVLRLFSFKFVEVSEFIRGDFYLSLLRLLGIVSFSFVLLMLAKQDGSIKKFFLKYSGYSFFIFAAHYPLIMIVGAVAVRVPGHNSPTGFFAMWLAVPLLTATLCVILAKLLERFLPAVFALLNGGRNGSAPPKQVDTVSAS